MILFEKNAKRIPQEKARQYLPIIRILELLKNLDEQIQYFEAKTQNDFEDFMLKSVKTQKEVLLKEMQNELLNLNMPYIFDVKKV